MCTRRIWTSPSSSASDTMRALPATARGPGRVSPARAHLPLAVPTLAPDRTARRRRGPATSSRCSRRAGGVVSALSQTIQFARFAFCARRTFAPSFSRCAGEQKGRAGSTALGSLLGTSSSTSSSSMRPTSLIIRRTPAERFRILSVPQAGPWWRAPRARMRSPCRTRRSDP